MIDLLFATSNKGKVREIGELLAPLNGMFQLKSYGDVTTDIPDIDEIYETFRENAFLKSYESAKLLGISTLADDSGLSVNALHGEPGVYSARYAERVRGVSIPRETRDSENNRELLNALAGVEDRSAYYIAVLALTLRSEDAVALFGSEFYDNLRELTEFPTAYGQFFRYDNYAVAIVEGRCDGVITHEPQGTNGFGYDPIFEINEFKKSAALLSLEEKNRVSHRRKGGDALLRLIRDTVNRT